MTSSNKKIFHIMPDEKFNDMAIRQFESAASGIHEYWILSNNNFVTYTKSSLIKIGSFEQIKYELTRKEISAVFFHSLPLTCYPLLENIPQGKKVFWFGWGADYYFMLPYDLYLPQTLSSIRSTLKSKLKVSVKNILQRFGLMPLSKSKSLRRIDYFSPVLDIEFQMVVQHTPHLSKAQYICWNYGTVEDDLSASDSASLLGDNILAGNSASATNNHIELFYTIKEQVDLNGRSVVVPLSYGDKEYKDLILIEGRKILGDSFLPLTDYMEKDKYIQTIQSCGFVAMNHMRQQAVGNACISMLMGAKIYLNEKNPLYRWLHLRGAHVGTLEKIDMKPLSIDQQECNRQIVYNHWGRKAQAEKTRHVIDTALNDWISA